MTDRYYFSSERNKKRKEAAEGLGFAVGGKITTGSRIRAQRAARRIYTRVLEAGRVK